MSNIEMTSEVLELVAARFKALAEPTRLRILSALREGERTVSDLVEETGLGQANVSKHLQRLHDLRYVERRREGLYTVYSLADEDVFALCDIVCGRLEREAEKGRALIGG
ncbi:MAG: metalloregulator ArsR/SmtB family transcription factor [Gemmatimonadota bacterium]|nr:metalloregulator ArsR/SmtB family transcription factor [Gemmatimonadota bacterium]